MKQTNKNSNNSSAVGCKLSKHHIEWLERNDGCYTVESNRGNWLDEHGNHVENRCIFVFKSTMFAFNPKGLTQAIDSAIELYPDS